MKVNSLSSAASKSYKALAFFSSFLGLLFEGAEIGEEAAAVGKRANLIIGTLLDPILAIFSTGPILLRHISYLQLHFHIKN